MWINIKLCDWFNQSILFIRILVLVQTKEKEKARSVTRVSTNRSGFVAGGTKIKEFEIRKRD